MESATRRLRRGDLIHYSFEPLDAVYSVCHRPDVGPDGYRSQYEKPAGIWVSVLGPNDWPSWCRAEDFRDTRRQHAYRLNLAPHAKVLRLTCAEDIDQFSGQYGSVIRWGPAGRFTNRAIQWESVAVDYQGIVIAPYVWSRRLFPATDWYYTWDCASGCIWDAEAVSSIDTIRSPPDAREARQDELAQRRQRRDELHKSMGAFAEARAHG